ncbi:hypothetical protein GmRootV118_17850 [Variovorax sp. V118]|uniref:hypothetical protein n=1 Tax=Variovorax sp. V118 TaxID=3065954 RepID=UPI0034E8D95C
MGYGKFRNGPTSLGQQAANWMVDDKLTFTTRRRGGVVVRKSGEFKNIYQETAEDGFYCLGETLGKGTRILGSANGFNFSDRGPAPVDGGFTVAHVAYYGKGLGSVATNAAAGAYTDFDGKSCSAFTSTLKRTRDGKKLRDYFETPIFMPFEVFSTLAVYMRGSYWFDGSKHTFAAGLHAPVMVAGQHVQAFIKDDGKGNTELADTAYFPNQLGWYADAVALAPGVMMKMDRYLRPHYSGSMVNAAACPGLYFSYSLDAGSTWQSVSSAAMWDDEMATVIGLPTTLFPFARVFNEAISCARLVAAPLSRRFSVCMAVVPYVVPGDPPRVRAKVKLGLIDAGAGCSMFETVVLFDGDPDDALLFAGRGLLPIPGGVLIFTRDVTSGAHAGDDSWRYPARVRLTPNGTDLFERPPMPMKENYTGGITGYSKKVMVCPMWDGKHSLYKSTDYGLTWVRAGTITATGVPPNDAPNAGDESFC